MYLYCIQRLDMSLLLKCFLLIPVSIGSWQYIYVFYYPGRFPAVRFGRIGHSRYIWTGQTLQYTRWERERDLLNDKNVDFLTILFEEKTTWNWFSFAAFQVFLSIEWYRQLSSEDTRTETTRSASRTLSSSSVN